MTTPTGSRTRRRMANGLCSFLSQGRERPSSQQGRDVAVDAGGRRPIRVLANCLAAKAPSTSRPGRQTAGKWPLSAINRQPFIPKSLYSKFFQPAPIFKAFCI